MGWEYILLDAGWHRMAENELNYIMQYAQNKNIGIWLWYHSGAGKPTETIDIWNLMSDPESRNAELDKIQSWGVKGIKIDFFDTDKQGIIQMYKTFLEETAQRKIMVNFHGATLPRGLERTYPNLMTTEAVKGAESFTNQNACNKAPEHLSLIHI